MRPRFPCLHVLDQYIRSFAIPLYGVLANFVLLWDPEIQSHRWAFLPSFCDVVDGATLCNDKISSIFNLNLVIYNEITANEAIPHHFFTPRKDNFSHISGGAPPRCVFMGDVVMHMFCLILSSASGANRLANIQTKDFIGQPIDSIIEVTELNFISKAVILSLQIFNDINFSEFILKIHYVNCLLAL